MSEAKDREHPVTEQLLEVRCGGMTAEVVEFHATARKHYG